MKILVVIPARGGSERLPGKNIRLLGGKPLIVWSIDVVRDVCAICDTLVSTDHLEIAQIAKQAGALVPWMRPPELATNAARSVDVAIHALNWYEITYGKVDGVLLLQPTSPFRSRKTVVEGIKLFKDNGFKPVLAISPTHIHPMWTFKLKNGYLSPFMREYSNFNCRSQDLPDAYIINGSFYLAHPQQLRKQESFIDETTIPLIIDSPKEALDIDTEWDWRVAKCCIQDHIP
ncbi:acylneuraminate cytidylyltransferase family protein [Geitlerinema sp. CS-897]|nr:acylneuraminate cytidylyltransferase family protein [Geitlerinema sp. CS-897]